MRVRAPRPADRCTLLLLAALLPLLASAPAAAQRTDAAAVAYQEFWQRLQQLCGHAFEGRAVEGPPDDSLFAGRRLVAHAHSCAPDEIRIALHADEDRSRTWVVSRTPAGLRLKHDHRRRDGSPDANTGYGGDTAVPGTIWRQEFPADAFSIAAVPARVTNVWVLELRPGEQFVYALRREATGLRYRMVFDLARPVAAPPPAWGYESVGGGKDVR